jgi:hypothetical protein
LEITKTVLSLMLVVITILTTLTTTIAAVYAGGDDDNGDGNKNKAEEESAAAIADCDDNEVEQAGFDCIAIATNDVEIETAEEQPPGEERATLSVCKTTTIPNMSPEDFDFSILEGGGVNSPPDADPIDFQGDANCVDVDIGPGEYVVSEETLPPEFGTSIEEGSDCVQDDESEGIASGFIQAGETQECRYINFVDPT